MEGANREGTDGEHDAQKAEREPEERAGIKEGGFCGCFFLHFGVGLLGVGDAESPLASVGGISFVEAGGMIVQLPKEGFYLMNGGVSCFFLEIFRKQNLTRRSVCMARGVTRLLLLNEAAESSDAFSRSVLLSVPANQPHPRAVTRRQSGISPVRSDTRN